MAKLNGRILVVDDEQDILLAARMFLKQHFTIVQTENQPQKLQQLLSNETFDVVMLDMNFSIGNTTGKEGFHWLNKVLSLDPSVPVIMMTAYGDIELAVKAIKEGAFDFVLKPWENEKLLATVLAAFQLRQTRLEVQHLRSREKLLSEALQRDFGDIIGRSPAMQKVFATIEKVAATDANILILGENGTGKELVARALHNHSLRAAEPFISVDLGAISESLFESELFGHTKGAFTDAKEDRPGRFEIANKGTLFLDEIGNLSLPLQSKLLTSLQSRQVIRVGSNKNIPVDIRLICATNLPVYEMVAQNRFRQDLLYRINTVEIQLPPLREREEDIVLLAEHFLSVFGKKYNKSKMRFSPTTLKKLEKYHWPGNIRELQHAVERAVIMSDSSSIQPSDFSFSLPESRAAEKQSINLEEVERTAIRKVLSKHAGNISHAAKELGLTRAALYRRIEKYGL
jgi:two-component system response regulator HydG